MYCPVLIFRVKGLAVAPGNSDLLFSAASDGFVKAWKLEDPLVCTAILVSVYISHPYALCE